MTSTRLGLKCQTSAFPLRLGLRLEFDKKIQDKKLWVQKIVGPKNGVKKDKSKKFGQKTLVQKI